MLKRRLDEVSAQVANATVQLAEYSPAELQLARELSEHFEIGFGKLVRRAEAVRLAGGQCLREAAQHLILLDE